MIEEKPSSSVKTPDPQVKQKIVRRAFTSAYKLSILEQADQCQGHGELGKLLIIFLPFEHLAPTEA